jgi:hypothetical protein
VDGKAKLVSDVYSDGLGACLGHCPQDAIQIIHREAQPFDEAAVAKHLVSSASEERASSQPTCPSVGPQSLRLNVLSQAHASPPVPAAAGGSKQSSALGNWPIQLHLVPPAAPFLQDADLVLAADCVPFACPDFHGRVLQGRPLLIGCPKLDDAEFYVKKLAAILVEANVQRVTVAHMEVPCCTGLVRIVEAARSAAGREIPLEHVTVSVRGEILETAAP